MTAVRTCPVVVVVFGMDPAPGWCDLSQCPRAAYLFDTDAEAEAFMESQPDWRQPHRLDVLNWPKS